MSARTTVPIPLIAAVAFALGCTAGDKARTDTAAAAPTVVTLTATDYAFHTPGTLVAGWTTFRLLNNGGQPHMGQLIRLDPGVALDDYLQAYGEAFRTAGPRPESGKRLGGPGLAAPHQTTNATLNLEPGNYVWICLYNLPDGVPHVVSQGMAEPFVVEAADVVRRPQTAPEADIVMRLAEYDFSLSAPLTAGRRMIRVENAGSESHEAGVLRLAAGKTMKDLLAWLQNPGEAPPESTWSIAGGVTSLAPGAEAYLEVDLTPGEYVLLCFVTAPDGRSHVEHGMIQQISVD